ncbi:MAG: sugar transferase [Anaerolineales bacterium]|jgi:exopolysaccharide biosynthesis polyprenyl glycosylphosphotransferase
MQTPMTGVDSPLELSDKSLRARVMNSSKSVSRKTQWRLFTATLVLSDVLMTAVAFRLAFLVRFELNIPIFYLESEPSVFYYQRLVIILTPLLIALFALSGLYDRKNLLGGTREYSAVFNATTITMFIVIAVGFLDQTFIIARAWLLLAWAFTFFLTAFSRFLLRRVIYSLRHRGFFVTPALVVGANEEGLSLAKQLLTWKTSGLNVLGFVDEKLPSGTRLLGGLQVLGTVNQLDDLIETYDVEEIILAASAISSREKMLDIFKCYGVAKDVNVRLSSGLYEIITTGLSIKEFAYVPLVEVNKVRLTGIDRFLKLLLDYSITLPGLILISPIMLIIGLAIKLDSPGSVIHRRRVMGVNGTQFDAYKFRTMYVNGDEILDAHPDLKEELEKNHKLKDDPRVTRMGRFLRSTSLDELPQLLNVLRREMSLVGPRMISPEEIDMYDQWDINLLTVQPGITGLWQVSGRSDIAYKQRVRMDMHYIRNWSIWLDIQLLIQTIPAVLRGRGAY